MIQKKKLNLANKNRKLTKILTKIFVVTIVLLLFVVLAVAPKYDLPLGRNIAAKEFYAAKLQWLFNNFYLSGTQIYDGSIRHKECVTSKTKTLLFDIQCDLLGQKYYLHKDDLKNNLFSAYSNLWSYGFVLDMPRDKADEAFGRMLSGEPSSQLRFKTRDHQPIYAYLEFYSNQQKGDSGIQRFIKDGKIASPKEGEYIYGVRAEATYWTCKNVLYRQLCPVPPTVETDTEDPMLN